MNMNNKDMCVGLFSVAALGLQITSVSTDFWTVSDNLNWGLWKMCAKGMKCAHLPPPNDSKFPANSLRAAQAFALLGPILVALAVLCMWLYPERKDCQCALLALGGVASLIAMIIWLVDLLKISGSTGPMSQKGTPGYSFYLNLAGGVSALIASGCCYQGGSWDMMKPLGSPSVGSMGFDYDF